MGSILENLTNFVETNELIRIVQAFVYSVPIFPYLWIPHCIMMSLAVRATVGGVKFAKSHPLACYMMAVVYTFPGGILASIALAEPPLAFLANTPSMVTMSITWYLIFFSPYDVFAKLIASMHLRYPLGFLQDFQRIQLVISAVQTIHALHPNTLLYPIVIATIKSSGLMFIKYVEAILFNVKLPTGFTVPNHTSKTCILAAVLFTARSAGILDVGVKPLLLCHVLLSLSLRIASMFPSSHAEPDPYLMFERASCYVLFGEDDEHETGKNTCGAKQESNTAPHNGTKNGGEILERQSGDAKNKCNNEKVILINYLGSTDTLLLSNMITHQF